MSEYFSSRLEAKPESSFGEDEPNLSEVEAQKRLMDQLLDVASGAVAMPGGNPARKPGYRLNRWLELVEGIDNPVHRAKISKVITEAEESFYKKKREVALGGAGKDGGEPSPDTVRGFLRAVAYHMMPEDRTLSVADMNLLLVCASNFADQYRDEHIEVIGPPGKVITRARLIELTNDYKTRNAKQNPETPNV